MTVPLVILAVLSAGAGWALLHPFEHFLAPSLAAAGVGAPHEAPRDIQTVVMVLSLTAGAVGLALAAYAYLVRADIPDRIVGAAGAAGRIAGAVHDLVANKFYVDEFYEATAVRAVWLAGIVSHAFDRYVIEKGESWPHDGQEAATPVQALRLGEVGLVALPAEIFARIGLESKHFSPAPFTFVVELANADVSIYVPTTDQAERGAYGAKPILSRWLCSDAGRRLADASQVMLWRLWEGDD